MKIETRAGISLLSLVVVAAVVAGCGGPASAPTTSQPSGPPIDAALYLLSQEPGGAQDVIKARKASKSEEEVVIVGRIGGDKNPWVEGRAAFSIVDKSLKACSDIPGDKCPHPWDYCCESNLSTSKALVKVVDENGKLLGQDARTLLNVKELQTVVVRGKAQRDEKGNLTVLATGVYVKK